MPDEPPISYEEKIDHLLKEDAEKSPSAETTASPQPHTAEPGSHPGGYTPQVLGPPRFVALYHEIEEMCRSGADTAQLPAKWHDLQRVLDQLVDGFTVEILERFNRFLESERVMDPKFDTAKIASTEDIYVGTLANQIQSWAADLVLATGKDNPEFRSLLLASLIDTAYKATFEKHDLTTAKFLFAGLGTTAIERLIKADDTLPEAVKTRYNEMNQLFTDNTHDFGRYRELLKKNASTMPAIDMVYKDWGGSLEKLGNDKAKRDYKRTQIELLGNTIDMARVAHADKKRSDLGFLEGYPATPEDIQRLERSRYDISFKILPRGEKTYATIKPRDIFRESGLKTTLKIRTKRPAISEDLKIMALEYDRVNQAAAGGSSSDKKLPKNFANAVKNGQAKDIKKILIKYGFLINPEQAENIKQEYYLSKITSATFREQIKNSGVKIHVQKQFDHTIVAQARLAGFRSTTEYVISKINDAYATNNFADLEKYLPMLGFKAEQVNAIINLQKVYQIIEQVIEQGTFYIHAGRSKIQEAKNALAKALLSGKQSEIFQVLKQPGFRTPENDPITDNAQAKPLVEALSLEVSHLLPIRQDQAVPPPIPSTPAPDISTQPTTLVAPPSYPAPLAPLSPIPAPSQIAPATIVPQTKPAYQFIIGEDAIARLKQYKQDLIDGTKQPGTFLSQELTGKDLEAMSDTDFLQCLLTTKRPTVFAENPHFFNDQNPLDYWSADEVAILGNISVSVPVTVYSDASRSGAPVTHKKPFEGELLFVAAPLLANAEKSPDYQAVIGENGAIDKEKYYQLLKEKLLPTLLHINQQAIQDGQPAVISCTGLGCGQFAGDFQDEVPEIFMEAVGRMLKENAGTLTHIAGFNLDLFSRKHKVKENYNGIQFTVRDSKEDGIPQLSDPAKLGHPGCKLYKIVAADHLAMPGCDYNTDSLYTDEGAAAAATDLQHRMTGIEGRYASGRFIPTTGGRWINEYYNDPSNYRNPTATPKRKLLVQGNVSIVGIPSPAESLPPKAAAVPIPVQPAPPQKLSAAPVAPEQSAIEAIKDVIHGDVGREDELVKAVSQGNQEEISRILRQNESKFTLPKTFSFMKIAQKLIASQLAHYVTNSIDSIPELKEKVITEEDKKALVKLLLNREAALDENALAKGEVKLQDKKRMEGKLVPYDTPDPRGEIYDKKAERITLDETVLREGPKNRIAKFLEARFKLSTEDSQTAAKGLLGAEITQVQNAFNEARAAKNKAVAPSPTPRSIGQQIRHTLFAPLHWMKENTAKKVPPSASKDQQSEPPSHPTP